MPTLALSYLTDAERRAGKSSSQISQSKRYRRGVRELHKHCALRVYAMQRHDRPPPKGGYHHTLHSVRIPPPEYLRNARHTSMHKTDTLIPSSMKDAIIGSKVRQNRAVHLAGQVKEHQRVRILIAHTASSTPHNPPPFSAMATFA